MLIAMENNFTTEGICYTSIRQGMHSLDGTEPELS